MRPRTIHVAPRKGPGDDQLLLWQSRCWTFDCHLFAIQWRRCTPQCTHSNSFYRVIYKESWRLLGIAIRFFHFQTALSTWDFSMKGVPCCGVWALSSHWALSMLAHRAHRIRHDRRRKLRHDLWHKTATRSPTRGRCFPTARDHGLFAFWIQLGGGCSTPRNLTSSKFKTIISEDELHELSFDTSLYHQSMRCGHCNSSDFQGDACVVLPCGLEPGSMRYREPGLPP